MMSTSGSKSVPPDPSEFLAGALSAAAYFARKRGLGWLRDEIDSEATLLAAVAMTRFDPSRQASPRTWANTYASFRLRDWLRRERGRRRHLPMLCTKKAFDFDALAHREPEAESDTAAILAALLRRLPVRERRAVKAARLSGMTQLAAASVLGVSQSRVSQLVSTAIRRMREMPVSAA